MKLAGAHRIGIGLVLITLFTVVVLRSNQVLRPARGVESVVAAERDARVVLPQAEARSARTSAEAHPSPAIASTPERHAARGDSSCTVRVRFVDRHGVPIEGVSFGLVEGDLAPASSGRDGVARLVLDRVLA